jgi:hypothetical protein
MDVVTELERAVGQLLGRAGGPMHVRLILQPTVAALLAIRAGRRDAHAGNPPFLWQLVSGSGQRVALLKSAWQDVGKVFIVAVVLDAAYQGFVLHSFYPLQTLVVAVAVALVPYLVLRGITTRIVRRFGRGSAATPEPPTAAGSGAGEPRRG